MGGSDRNGLEEGSNVLSFKGGDVREDQRKTVVVHIEYTEEKDRVVTGRLIVGKNGSTIKAADMTRIALVNNMNPEQFLKIAITHAELHLNGGDEDG